MSLSNNEHLKMENEKPWCVVSCLVTAKFSLKLFLCFVYSFFKLLPQCFLSHKRSGRWWHYQMVFCTHTEVHMSEFYDHVLTCQYLENTTWVHLYIQKLSKEATESYYGYSKITWNLGRCKKLCEMILFMDKHILSCH